MNTNGLKFNPTKTMCVTFGPNSLSPGPLWNMANTPLQCSDSMKYLGTILHMNATPHVNSRIQAARRAFYSLQAAGLYTSTDKLVYLWNAAIRPTLIYGLSCISLTKSDIRKIESAQGTFIKSALKLPKICHTSPLLAALNIKGIGQMINYDKIKLLNRLINGNSCTRMFYSYLLKCSNNAVSKTLISSVRYICKDYHFNFTKTLLDQEYIYYTKKCIMKDMDFVQCGISDSVRTCLSDDNIFMAKLLLLPF